MNADRLKGELRSNAMTQEAVAAHIGLSLSRLNAKINGTQGAEFSLGEVQALKQLLHLTAEQVDSIFFA